MPKVPIEVEVGDQKVQTEIDTDALGLLTADQVAAGYMPRDVVNEEIQRRVVGAKKGRYTPDEIAVNEEVLKSFIDSHRDTLIERLGVKDGKAADVDVEKLRESIRTAEVAPLAQERDALMAERNSLRVAHLRAEVANAAAALGIKKGLMPLVTLHYEANAAWDDDHGSYFLKDGDGFAYSRKPEKGKAPFLTISEDLEGKRSSDEFGDWFEAQSRDGIDFKGQRGPGGGHVTLEEFDKMDSSQRMELATKRSDVYGRLMDEKERRGFDALAAKSGAAY